MTRSIKNAIRFAQTVFQPKKAERQANKEVVTFLTQRVNSTRQEAGNFLERAKTFVGLKAREVSKRFSLDTEFSNRTGRVTKRTVTYNNEPISSRMAQPLKRIASAAGQAVESTVVQVAAALPAKPSLALTTRKPINRRSSIDESKLTAPARQPSIADELASVSKAPTTAAPGASGPDQASATQSQGRTEKFQVNPDLPSFGIDTVKKEMGAGLANFLKYGTYNF